MVARLKKELLLIRPKRNNLGLGYRARLLEEEMPETAEHLTEVRLIGTAI